MFIDEYGHFANTVMMGVQSAGKRYEALVYDEGPFPVPHSAYHILHKVWAYGTLYSTALSICVVFARGSVNNTYCQNGSC